jgi:small subunit ribosomal protein S16
VAVKIRLMRVGKRKQPTYRVVVADSRSPRDGRIIETIGHYGPREEPSRVDIDGDKALAWLRKGAQPSEQVQKLLTVTGVWATFEGEKKGPIDTKLNRRGFSTGRGVTTKTKKKAPEGGKSEEKPAAAEAPADDAPPADEAPAAEAETEAPAAEETAAEEESS